MKTKILLVLAVVLSLLGVSEIKAQMDTLWSYPIQTIYHPSAWTFSNDDSLIAITMNNKTSDTSKHPYILLLNTITGDSIKAIKGIYQSDDDKIIFTPDNKFILSNSFTWEQGIVNIIMWNTNTGDSVRKLSIDSITDLDKYNYYFVHNLQFTPDGRYLFANISKRFGDLSRAENFNHFVFWDTTNWQIAKQWKSFNQPSNMVISPRGTYYAYYYGESDSGNCIKIASLDAADTLIKTFYMGQKNAWECIFSKDGKYLAARCSNDTILIWDMDSLLIYRILSINQGHVYEFAFATDSSCLITEGNKLQPTTVWNLNSLNQIYNYQDTVFLPYFLKASNTGQWLGEFSNLNNRFYLYNSHFTPNPVVERGDKHEQSVIYPNPSDKITKLKFNSAEMSTISVQIIDTEGHTVKDLDEKIFEAGENDINLDCSGLTSGIYFCRMTGKNLNKTYKLIIKK